MMELKRFQSSYLLGIKCLSWKEYLYHPTAYRTRWKNMPLLNKSRDRSEIDAFFLLSKEDFSKEEKGISGIARMIFNYIGSQVLPGDERVNAFVNKAPLVCMGDGTVDVRYFEFHYFLNRQGDCCNAEDQSAYVHIELSFSLSINGQPLRTVEVEEIFHGLYDPDDVSLEVDDYNLVLE